jgi:cytochrome P450
MADTATALKSYNDIPVLDWDLQNPVASSYDLFKDLREQTPLVKVPMGMGSLVMALRARMVDQIVSPENTRQLETELKMMQGIFDGPIFDFVAQVMLFANGDAHQRRRQPVARTFAFKLMEAMRPKAAAIATEIINEHLGKGPVDFLKDFAAQLPARIIADILGIPRADLPVFMRWISDTSESIGFVDVSRRADIEQSLTAFNAYVDKLLADRRSNPRGDFLSDYVAATAASGDLTEQEIRAQVVGLDAHDGHLDVGNQIQQFARQVLRGAGASRAIANFVRLFFC